MTDEKIQVDTEDFYREKSPRKRGEILERLLAQDPGEDNQIRREIYDLRYDKKNIRPDGDLADRYIELWMNMRMTAGHGGGFFGYKRDRKLLGKSLAKLGISKYSAMEGNKRQLMYRELFHMAALYLNASLTDRNYTSALMGMMSLKEEQIQNKVTRDVFEVAYKVPRMVEMEEEFSLFTRAVCDAFVKLRPDCEEYLGELVATLENDKK